MFHWLFDLLNPNYEPPVPLERTMQLARDSVTLRCRKTALETTIRSVVHILDVSEMPLDRRVEAAKEMLTNVLTEKEPF